MAFTQAIKTLGSVMASMKTTVDTWLSQNITNPSNPPLDRSLSLSNACAPADMVGDLKNDLEFIEETQIIDYFNDTVSGTRSYSAQVSVPAGTYKLTISSVISSDTQYTTSRIIFYYVGSGSKSIDVDRGKAIDMDVALTSDVQQISFYGAHSYSDSAGVTFAFNSVKVQYITPLRVELDNIEKSLSDIGVIDFSTVENLIFDGKGALKAANFEQGYMSAGTGWVSTGSGDSLKYITFRNNSKLNEGSKISVTCPNHYCAIDLYSDNNWNASSSRIAQESYSKNIELILPYSGYVAISVSTSNKYAQRTAITPSDYEENIIITPINSVMGEVITAINKMPLTDGIPYKGERIDVSNHYCMAENYFPMTHTATESIQGGAAYGKYYFQFMDKFSGCAVYNLETKSLIQLIETQSVETYHCNNANFGIEFYDEDDLFPLLYVSMENITEHKVNVYRVTTENSVYGLTLVQTITWDDPQDISLYFPNAIIDKENNHIIQYGTKNNSWHSDSPGNALKFNVYNLPALSAGDVALPQTERIDYFELEMVEAPQGAVCHDGKIYMAYGLIGDYQLRSIDLLKKKYVSIIDLTDPVLANVTGTEQEAVFIYDGNLYCSNVEKNIWKLLA